MNISVLLKRGLLMVCVLFALTGCFEKRIDGTSKESYEASVREIKKTLTAEELENFEKSVEIIGMSNVQGLGDVLLMVSKPDNYEHFLMKRLDGKTAKEAIAEANAIVKSKGKDSPKDNAQ